MTLEIHPRAIGAPLALLAVVATLLGLQTTSGVARAEPARRPQGALRAGRQVIQPARFPNTGLPYSPGVLVNDTLYLSGQIGRDPATAKLVAGGIEGEARQALTNLGEVLRTAGMDYKDVVSVTAFIVSFDDFPKFNAVYREFFPADPPARATVQVAGLNLGARVEIQMVAARPRRD
jgi:2-iminobutanoate/2-iminopropanoate deaminase